MKRKRNMSTVTDAIEAVRRLASSTTVQSHLVHHVCAVFAWPGVGGDDLGGGRGGRYPPVPFPRARQGPGMYATKSHQIFAGMR